MNDTLARIETALAGVPKAEERPFRLSLVPLDHGVVMRSGRVTFTRPDKASPDGTWYRGIPIHKADRAERSHLWTRRNDRLVPHEL